MYRLALLLKEVGCFQIEPFMIFSVGVSRVMEFPSSRNNKSGCLI
jgi:hypothetical protein